MDVRIIIVLTAGLLISLLLIVLFSRRLSANIDIITDGLDSGSKYSHSITTIAR